jgi:hypothetical protein
MNVWQQKLAALKRHPLFPFVRFPQDQAQYALAELYWNYLFQSVVDDPAWRLWHAPDRTGEGNPIFSSIHLDHKRGTRVIQHPESGSGSTTRQQYFGFQPFLSITPAEPFDRRQNILELCLLADISPETEASCIAFWRRFCIDLAPEEQLEDEIRNYEIRVGMPEV